MSPIFASPAGRKTLKRSRACITSTGETGEGVTNDLTSTLAQFRHFEQWLGKGAPVLEQPNFPEPSTA